jgi:hypothetical protein
MAISRLDTRCVRSACKNCCVGVKRFIPLALALLLSAIWRKNLGRMAQAYSPVSTEKPKGQIFIRPFVNPWHLVPRQWTILKRNT